MAYQARRGNKEDDYDASQNYSEQRKAQDDRNTRNNANTINNAADVAMASKHPVAAAIGAGVKAADKLTGGKSTQMLGKAMTRANKMNPAGKAVQGASNKLAESGAGDKIGKAASLKSSFSGGGASKPGDAAGKTGGAAGKAGEAAKPGGALNTGSMPKTGNASNTGDNVSNIAAGAGPQKAKENLSTGGGDATGGMSKAPGSNRLRKGEQESSPSSSEGTSTESSEEYRSKGFGSFFFRKSVVAIIISVTPFFIVILLLLALVTTVTSIFDDYDDAFGMSDELGEETGGVEFNPSSKEQKRFLKRITNIQKEFQQQGKSFDAMKIVAIYHSLVSSNVSISYDDVTEDDIRIWADAMFSNNYYSEETFRENLTVNIFPHYKPHESREYYEHMTDEVFDYLERYYDLIEVEMPSSNCAAIGSCSYNIKGFSLPGRGNVVKNMQISNLKVRLMECGRPYGNGSYNTPINQDLVNFEDYVAGVAYAEVGPSASEEVLKAQMVVARSFALSRPTAMGNANGKKLVQENGQWILQISSCVADQVFCNIDLGCSYMGGGDGQGGIVRSGNVQGAVRQRAALPQNHVLRQAAAETQGEVLVNAQGYIISAAYVDTDQKKWASLARQGLNYKQILLQSYNSGSRNYGASDIVKAACGTSETNNCISTGEYSNWKQTDPKWSGTRMGGSSSTLGQIGCLVTSVSMLIAKSQVPVNINPFNPGTFVEFLNKHGGIDSGGNFQWGVATQAAPSFHYQGKVDVSGMSRNDKLNTIKGIVNQPGVYAVAEVKGNTGQHWVAIDSVTGSTINMMDPSSRSRDMWAQYNWANTSTIAYYKVG